MAETFAQNDSHFHALELDREASLHLSKLGFVVTRSRIDQRVVLVIDRPFDDSAYVDGWGRADFMGVILCWQR